MNDKCILMTNLYMIKSSFKTDWVVSVFCSFNHLLTFVYVRIYRNLVTSEWYTFNHLLNHRKDISYF